MSLGLARDGTLRRVRIIPFARIHLDCSKPLPLDLLNSRAHILQRD